LGSPVLFSKIFPLTRRANQRYQLAPSHPMRGAGRDRHERAVGCGGRSGHERRTWQVAYGEVVWSWRPDAGVKFVRSKSFSGMTVARKPGHRGEHEISRKPPRREGRIASAEPVCSCAFSYVHFAHETAGAARTRLSLRPLFPRRVESYARPGRITPRDRGTVSGIGTAPMNHATRLPHCIETRDTALTIR
jgi:hypothetical protein